MNWFPQCLHFCNKILLSLHGKIKKKILFHKDYKVYKEGRKSTCLQNTFYKVGMKRRLRVFVSFIINFVFLKGVIFCCFKILLLFSYKEGHYKLFMNAQHFPKYSVLLRSLTLPYSNSYAVHAFAHGTFKRCL